MLRMKITLYELLGLVKDGKAPKKIRYNNEIWELNDNNEYENNNYDKSLLEKLVYELYTLELVNDEVEIIEEPKKIEKISWREKESLAGNFTANEKQEILARRTEKLKSSLNELIDEINNLKEND